MTDLQELIALIKSTSTKEDRIHDFCDENGEVCIDSISEHYDIDIKLTDNQRAELDQILIEMDWL